MAATPRREIIPLGMNFRSKLFPEYKLPMTSGKVGYRSHGELMKLIAFLIPLALLACNSGSKRSEEPARQPVEERVVRTSSRIETSGYCSACHLSVYSAHVCGRSVPCALCQREHGARHFHEVVWTCPEDGTRMTEVHICNDSKTCDTCLHAVNRISGCQLCGEGKHGGLLTKGCTWCASPSPVVQVQGITSYCGTCNLEVGTNHIHGKTKFCSTCLREAGQGHTHDVTRLCMEHQRECGLHHSHGQTEYCQACRRDAGPNHRHGQTIWCLRCKVEAPWPHCHHTDEY